MRISLYARLAAQNIRKSRRLYVPYLLSGICMVMIHYVLGALNGDPAIQSMPGGSSLSMLLGLGTVVMVFFSTLFLLYTSSFLMKQRSRELSLYNMLGMSKRHIVYIVFFETLFCALICIGLGLALGVLSSKAFQLTLLRLTRSAVTPDFMVAPSLLLTSAGVFSAIFLLLFLRSAFGVARCNPVELMRESHSGEKPPRSNAFKALLGMVMLLAGYAMAVRVQSALDAFTLFFAAVLLVIAGTFLCFSSASVFFLRLLQANKGYYYKANHFISVSGMRYRMKRNGASLATICILSTMVLVVLSCVTCLYAGTEDELQTSYSREIEFKLSSLTAPEADALRDPVEQALARQGITPVNAFGYRSLSIAGVVKNGVLSHDSTSISYSVVTLIPLEDYNRLSGSSYTLNAGEALASGPLLARLDDSLSFYGETPYRIVEKGVPLPSDVEKSFGIVDSLLLVVPDASDLDALNEAHIVHAGYRSFIYTYYLFDTGLPGEEQIALAQSLRAALEEAGLNISTTVREEARADYESTNVGFLFLGSMLSAAFLCAAVLSMYYKQITEGYEDQARYEIMRKVGLSRRMIRQSINSQILTVFFLPLIAAGVHMAFAFPMLSKLLMIFGLINMRLLALTALASFGAFSLLYILVYLITSRTYYRIVSGIVQRA